MNSPNLKTAKPEQLICWLEMTYDNDSLQTKSAFSKEEINKEILQRLSSSEQSHLNKIRQAATDLMQWIEIEHRPPVRDALEGGRMVNVRLHALADLHQAINSN